jgi:RNA polymerase sigma-70 factor (ECF subfamily)
VARDPLANPEEAIRRLYGYVAYRMGPGPEAEDVVSDTVERALRYRDSYDHRKGSPAAWLTGIATRVMADAARARARTLDGDPEGQHAPVTDFSAASLRRLNLRTAMAELDERSQELLALRYGADLKAREIAELLEVRTNAVEVALSRALAKLRNILQDGPPAESDADTNFDSRS